MKRILFLLPLLAVLISCSKKEAQTEMVKNYVPETPKLDSDIMTPEVLWSFGRLGEAVVSPDGNTVLYSVTYYKIDDNKSYRDLYTVLVKGGKPKQITDTEVKESSASWRPDGKKIAYLSPVSGDMQLWEVNPDGTEAVQISKIKGGINGFKYSPDMKHILYTKDVKLDEDVHDLFPDLPESNARIENDLMYRHWDSWHNYTYSHIFVAGYSNGSMGEGKDIMEGEKFDSPDKPFDGMEQINWSPDGKQIAYSCKKLRGKAYSVSTNTDIYIYDIRSGETKNLTEGMVGYDKSPVFSPDGKYIAWESMLRDGYEADKARLFIADCETGNRKDYSVGFDQSSHGLSWGIDSRSLYFISDIQATDEIYKLTLMDGRIVRITNGIHNYGSAEETPHGLVAQKTSMSQPADLYLVDPSTGEDKPITKINEGILDQLTRGKVEKRWVRTTDNKEMLVWVVYPPHFDPAKKYPAILYCQGGPQSTVSQFWSYRWNFQMMAANGYIVVAPNRRGLPGFGQEWLEQISTDYGGQNMQDYLSAIDNVAKEPFVDKDRLGAVGASYGGFSVNYLAGHHEKRFKAFISHCGIFNFEQQYLTTEEMWFENFDMGGPYWDKTNEVAQCSFSFSPHLYVDKWDTPILIIHGGKDFRIPYTQGMAAFNAAVLRGIPAQFLYFPEENHWVLSPQNGILWQRVFKQWLDKWLKE
ncbi:MAG: S9 family peptidase [Prolixibacteraceae bacterium]|jgi:dipeptidyl aminopeptidase/acylaminoacyl peptidase|nr:S9 family peptidase [Prolixibacteraceae bacterium]